MRRHNYKSSVQKALHLRLSDKATNHCDRLQESIFKDILLNFTWYQLKLSILWCYIKELLKPPLIITKWAIYSLLMKWAVWRTAKDKSISIYFKIHLFQFFMIDWWFLYISCKHQKLLDPLRAQKCSDTSKYTSEIRKTTVWSWF